MHIPNNYLETQKRWNVFAKSDSLGSYCFLSMIISLDSLQKREFIALQGNLKKFNYEEAMKTRQMPLQTVHDLSKIFGLAYHEFTHFLDATATTWGLQLMKLINKAYLTNPKLHNVSEADFYSAKTLANIINLIGLPKYYTVINTKADSARPWSYKITAGRLFDSIGHVSGKPIPFISFYNSKSERLVRSPISDLSLLEASAMAQEVLYKNFLLATLSADNRLIEQQLLQRTLMSYIYNPSLTEYSVCVHLVANTQNCEDIISAFELCQNIVAIALNFTDELFLKLQFSVEASNMLQLNIEPHGSHILEGLKQRNRGFLFYVLTLLLPPESYKSTKAISDGVKASLKLVGINYFDVIFHARREIEVLSNDLSTSKILSIAKLAQSSMKNFDAKNDTLSGMYKFAIMDLPPVLFNNLEKVNMMPSPSNKLATLNLDSQYDELIAGQIWIENFSEACV